MNGCLYLICFEFNISNTWAHIFNDVDIQIMFQEVSNFVGHIFQPHVIYMLWRRVSRVQQSKQCLSVIFNTSNTSE